MSYTFNFLKILQQMQAFPDNPDVNLSQDQWLTESYIQPTKFWQDFFNYYASQFSTFAKSYPFEHYDFYHDIVLRNCHSERIALRWYQEGLGWQKLSFLDLHLQVTEEAQKWANRGLKAKDTVCIILPFGIKYVISLLTALKMGLIFSYLPPLGDQFLQKRLKILAPVCIISEYIYTRLLGDFEKLLFEKQEEKQVEYNEISYNYLTGEPVASLFSPLSKNPLTPLSLSCDAAYLYAARDGILTYFLRPGDAMMAPAFCTWQCQPALILSTLLTGSTYIHVDLETIKNIDKLPSLFQEISFRSFGLSGEFRDILLSCKNKIIIDAQYIFRNCAEPFYWERWTQFVKQYEWQKIPIQNIIIHAAFGGTILNSHLTKEFLNQEAYPAPGLKWSLDDVNLSGQSAIDFGVLNVQKEEDKTPIGTILLRHDDKKWMYLGTLDPRNSGRFYPWAEVLDTVSTLDFIKQVSYISITTGNRALHILLVFLGDCPTEDFEKIKKDWTSFIQHTIMAHLGEEFLPSSIQFYPLYAPTKEKIIDHLWCQTQYLRGYLHRKCQHPIYTILTKLRGLLE